MDDTTLGKGYADGEAICRQGEPGDRMYVMQAGQALVYRTENGHETVIGELHPGDLFGEMAIFEREPRSATVRAQGPARVLTLDKRGFLKRVHEDPSVAYRILRDMSRRLRTVSRELAQLRGGVSPAPRYLLVVAADRPDLFARLSEQCAADPGMKVIVDRRAGERRRRAESPGRDRREKDRRQREADDVLRSDGLLVIRAQPRS